VAACPRSLTSASPRRESGHCIAGGKSERLLL